MADLRDSRRKEGRKERRKEGRKKGRKEGRRKEVSQWRKGRRRWLGLGWDRVWVEGEVAAVSLRRLVRGNIYLEVI